MAAAYNTAGGIINNDPAIRPAVYASLPKFVMLSGSITGVDCLINISIFSASIASIDFPHTKHSVYLFSLTFRKALYIFCGKLILNFSLEKFEIGVSNVGHLSCLGGESAIDTRALHSSIARLRISLERS